MIDGGPNRADILKVGTIEERDGKVVVCNWNFQNIQKAPRGHTLWGWTLEELQKLSAQAKQEGI